MLINRLACLSGCPNNTSSTPCAPSVVCRRKEGGLLSSSLRGRSKVAERSVPSALSRLGTGSDREGGSPMTRGDVACWDAGSRFLSSWMGGRPSRAMSCSSLGSSGETLKLSGETLSSKVTMPKFYLTPEPWLVVQRRVASDRGRRLWFLSPLRTRTP